MDQQRKEFIKKSIINHIIADGPVGILNIHGWAMDQFCDKTTQSTLDIENVVEDAIQEGCAKQFIQVEVNYNIIPEPFITFSPGTKADGHN